MTGEPKFDDPQTTKEIKNFLRRSNAWTALGYIEYLECSNRRAENLIKHLQIEVSCTDCSLSIGSPCPTCNDEGLFDAYILEPNERVIDARRVKNLIDQMDDSRSNRDTALEELKKELGIE